jgi:hypothetical protein
MLMAHHYITVTAPITQAEVNQMIGHFSSIKRILDKEELKYKS